MYQAEKRSFRVHGRSTTIKLERPFWQALEEISWDQSRSLVALITDLSDGYRIDNGNPNDRPNLAPIIHDSHWV